MKIDDSDKRKIVIEIKALKIITIYVNHVICRNITNTNVSENAFGCVYIRAFSDDWIHHPNDSKNTKQIEYNTYHHTIKWNEFIKCV
jgi:hypothetical protein